MSKNRAPILFALLFLLFFVSTSAGFADVSSIQEQLREIQLKLIREKVKLLQEGILNVRPAPPAPLPAAPPAPTEPQPTREELSHTLEEQIRTLQGVVATLKPRAVEEEAAEIEGRIAAIGVELKTASDARLVSLQDELQNLIARHAALEKEVRQELDDALKYKQAVLIGQQIRTLQEKVATLPRIPAPAPVQTPDAGSIRETIEKLQLKLLQAQVKAIQEKVGQAAR